MTDQPNPSPCLASIPVWPTVMAALESRPILRGAGRFLGVLVAQRAKGLAKYGTELHTFNGRDAMRDFEEEIADALQYGIQAIMENPARATGVLEAVTFLQAQLVKAATIIGKGAP